MAGENNIRNLAQGGQIQSVNPTDHAPGPFVRFVVIDVITDPTSIDSRLVGIWRSASVKGLNFLENQSDPNHPLHTVPRNTIIALPLQGDGPPEVVFPFFPSHLAFPCNPGEVVWGIYETMNWNGNDVVPYWLCKVAQPHFVDDVNHTHMPRIHEPSYFPNLKNRSGADGMAKPFHELRIGSVSLKQDDERNTSSLRRYLSTKREDFFELLVTNTDAANTKVYEAVPRFKKRPGDVAIEGTNNSLIVLGNDRKGKSFDYDGKSFPKIPSDDLKESAGSIDIVVGRGQTERTFGHEASTTRIVDATKEKPGSEIKKELDKTPFNVVPQEGDPDLFNDRSRILLSQRTKVDKNFGLDSYNSQYEITDNSTSGDSSVVAKADKIRLISRSDFEVLSTGFNPGKSPVGKDIKNELSGSEGQKQWSSLILKQNGDVIVSNAKDRIFSVGANADAVDTSKAMLTLDSGKKQVLVPLVDNGTTIIGADNTSSALGVFDNGSKTISLGGGDQTALQFIDSLNKIVTIGTALGVFDVKTGAVSLGGGAVAIAGPPGGSGAPPGPPASSVVHHTEVNAAMNALLTAISAISAFLAANPSTAQTYAPVATAVTTALGQVPGLMTSAKTVTKMQ